MTRRVDPFADTRIRLEGRLEDLEAAEEQYEACAARRTAEWTKDQVEALQHLERRAGRAREALVHLFRGQPLPVEEAALLFRVDRARDRFLQQTWARLTGNTTPPGDTSQAEVFSLLDAVHLAVDDPWPIYERMTTPTFSWQGPPRPACRLSSAGLISQDRFFPMEVLLREGVRRESGDEGPEQCWVGDHALEYRDQFVVRACVELLQRLRQTRVASSPFAPSTWVIGAAQINAAPLRPRVVFTAEGAYHFASAVVGVGLEVAQVARTLDGLPIDQVDRFLRTHDAGFMPLEEVRYRLQPSTGEQLTLSWNQAELELSFAPGDARRLLERLKR